MKSTDVLKFKDIKDKDIKELQSLLKEKKLKLFELRLQLKTMQLTDFAQISVVRKEIARINTAISAKSAS
ncbi:50S ribosomal protein L29 [Helicobacter sp. 23-1044]